MLAIPPFGASSNIALWRANIKPPVELVVDDLVYCWGEKNSRLTILIEVYNILLEGNFSRSRLVKMFSSVKCEP